MKQALKEVPCRHVDCPALVVLSVLASQKQFGVALAGGAVRDTYFKRPVKDHDIVVWGWEFEHWIPIEFAMESAGYKQYAEHTQDPEYGGVTDGRYACIMQWAHPTHPKVDILIYDQAYTSLESILHVHDHNINQFAKTMDDPSKSNMQTTYYAGDNYGALEQVRFEKVTPERRERMVQYALDVGWKVPNE